MQDASFTGNLKQLLQNVAGAPLGTLEFYVLIAVAAIVLLIGGKLFSGMIGGGKRGSLIILIGNLIVAAAALLGFAAVQTFLPGQIGNAGTLFYVSAGVAIVLALIAVAVVSKPLMDTGPVFGFLTSLFSLALAVAAMWAGNQLFATLDRAGDKVDELQEQLPD